MLRQAPPPPPPQAPLLRHLLIAGAAPPPGAAAPPAPPPHLAALWPRLAPCGQAHAEPDSPDTALAPLLAAALALPGAPGRWPWAAWDSGSAGVGCAWLTPCHWQPGMDHVLLHEPLTLDVGVDDLAALQASLAPLLADDGITLTAQAANPAAATPARWLARGAVFEDLPCVSLERAAGQHLTRQWLTAAPSRALRRLLAEVQMLLHSHPVNDARAARGLPPLNALWIDGAGRLDALPDAGASLRVDARLRRAALDGTAAWQAAWAALDAQAIAPLAAQAARGQPVRLTLAGPRRAITLCSADAPSGWRRWAQRLRGGGGGVDWPALLATLDAADAA